MARSALTLLVTALALSSVGCGSSRAKSSDTAGAPDTTAKLIRTAEHELLRALVSKDYDRVNNLLADDFELITPTGDVVAKDVYLSGPAFAYRLWKPITPIRVRVYGNVAVIRYEAEIRIQGGIAGRDWHTDLYEKRGDRWKMVWSQATAAA